MVRSTLSTNCLIQSFFLSLWLNIVFSCTFFVSVPKHSSEICLFCCSSLDELLNSIDHILTTPSVEPVMITFLSSHSLT
uniref:Putative secreted peptide n=1 Tax=Anopheles braziliensis TaxID=58242 RepID=A0A2M3ZTK6_9DIPT